MPNTIKPQFSLFELHHPKTSQLAASGCGLVVYDGKRALGRTPALAEWDDAALFRMAGTDCGEDGWGNRIASANVSGATLSERLAGFAIRHQQVQEAFGGDNPDMRDVRELGEKIVAAFKVSEDDRMRELMLREYGIEVTSDPLGPLRDEIAHDMLVGKLWHPGLADDEKGLPTSPSVSPTNIAL